MVRIERVQALAERLGFRSGDEGYPGVPDEAVSDVFVLLERLVDILEADGVLDEADVRMGTEKLRHG